MRRVSHIRNLAVSIAVIVGILLVSGLRSLSTASDNALAADARRPLLQSDFLWNPTTRDISAVQGATVQVTYTLVNNSDFDETYLVDIPDLTTDIPGAQLQIAPSNIIFVQDNDDAVVTFQIRLPDNAATGLADLTVQATKQGTSETSIAFFNLTITPPPSNTPEPSATVGPSPTPRPACENGVENDDPGGDQGSAQLILVDVLVSRGICRIGDEDWFYFGAVGGKVYTIDIPRMDNGLDLSLDLYDSDGNPLASNDDYFNRPSGTTGAGPSDIRPQIDSWRAPRDGTYYFRVRDTLNLGGGDRTYDVIVRSESYGPTPITVPLICLDLFEPDGLPENARLITSNEIQVDHRLCPAGDADWVRFFGKAGKTYYMYTDTRPYRRDQIGNRDPINGELQAGADTVIYLADRDGTSILDFNDDIDGSLDSEIRFTPPADGFYYVQIKNVGDIGNQFIRYDFSLKLCVPNDECGRSPVAPPAQPAPTAQGTPQPTSEFIDATEEAATATAEEQTAIANDTAQALTEEAEEDEDNFLEQSVKPGPMVNGPIQGFADRSFEQVWQRNDRPVAEQRAQRSWAWGPRGLMARTESYLQAAGGLRQVQYFDKGRMEVNDPGGDRASRWFVTTGLLVIELITGKTQIGDNQFVQHAPADIPIAGDSNDPNAPTYASFGGVMAQPSGDRTGQLPAETLNRAGQVGSYAGPARPETRLAYFAGESGHNIPQVFWDYLNARGLVYEDGYHDGQLLDWVFTLGYPVSEAYWVRIRVGGVERDVLVQPFQRRVLTYSPDNPSGWQVEMGNVGRHYYRWRYGEELPAP